MPLRDPKTGRLLPGGTSLNPTGSRVKGHREYLRELLGQRAEKAFDGILAIAEGRMTFEALSRQPGPNEDSVSAALIPQVTVQPSIRERLDAYRILIEHTVGRPVSTVEIDATTRHTHEVGVRDLSALPDEHLAALELLLASAPTVTPAASQTVEAEVVP